VVPSAVTVAGLKLTVDRVGDTVGADGGTNVTVTVPTRRLSSVTSVAVRVAGSAVVSVTVNEACPSASVVWAVAGLTAAVLPGPSVRVTLLPPTGWTPPAVSRVTTTVVPELPVGGEVVVATTVEEVVETTRLPNVTVGVVCKVTPPAVAV
jgi:hypothetical protein